MWIKRSTYEKMVKAGHLLTVENEKLRAEAQVRDGKSGRFTRKGGGGGTKVVQVVRMDV